MTIPGNKKIFTYPASEKSDTKEMQVFFKHRWLLQIRVELAASFVRSKAKEIVLKDVLVKLIKASRNESRLGRFKIIHTEAKRKMLKPLKKEPDGKSGVKIDIPLMI